MKNANKDTVLHLMSQSEQMRIRYTDKSGNIREGFVDVFETRYDNNGEASICFAGDSGECSLFTRAK